MLPVPLFLEAPRRTTAINSQVSEDYPNFRLKAIKDLLHKFSNQNMNPQYSLPISYRTTCIDDPLDQLGRSRIFTSPDLALGYWKISLDPKDAHKIAFRAHHGLFQFTHTPFGLSVVVSMFQRTTNATFKDLST